MDLCCKIGKAGRCRCTKIRPVKMGEKERDWRQEHFLETLYQLCSTEGPVFSYYSCNGCK